MSHDRVSDSHDPLQVVDLSSGLMQKLDIKMASNAEEDEGNCVVLRHQVSRFVLLFQNNIGKVGPGEGVVNLRASVLPSNGMKLNSEASSSWKLTVDAVQVIASRDAQAPEHQKPFS